MQKHSHSPAYDSQALERNAVRVFAPVRAGGATIMTTTKPQRFQKEKQSWVQAIWSRRFFCFVCTLSPSIPHMPESDEMPAFRVHSVRCQDSFLSESFGTCTSTLGVSTVDLHPSHPLSWTSDEDCETGRAVLDLQPLPIYLMCACNSSTVSFVGNSFTSVVSHVNSLL